MAQNYFSDEKKQVFNEAFVDIADNEVNTRMSYLKTKK